MFNEVAIHKVDQTIGTYLTIMMADTGFFWVTHWLQSNYDNDSLERKFGHSHCPLWHCSQGTLSNSHQSPTTLSPMTSCPLPLGVSAPFPADLFQNVSFSSRLCCLFYRSLSLCCERLRLLVMEVNLTNLWISPISFGLVFFPFFLHILFSFSVPRSISPPVHCFVFTYL